VRQPIIAANWKMHKTVSEAVEFIGELQELLPYPTEMDIVLAAPFTALAFMHSQILGTPLYLAAQDLFWQDAGAYTGEISAPMLLDVGCSYVIIGHSERRQHFGETDETVRKKVSAALHAGLRPIVCIGESLTQREAGETLTVIAKQIHAGLADCNATHATQIVLAYEPIWAIGTGVTATPAQAQEVHSHMRTLVQEMWGAEAAQAIRLQYGGSVNAETITPLMAEADIDGALVGGASLDVKAFARILSYGRHTP
jgi:triosephosphate isomerase